MMSMTIIILTKLTRYGVPIHYKKNRVWPQSVGEIPFGKEGKNNYETKIAKNYVVKLPSRMTAGIR